MRLYIIRHAETEYNKLGLIQGSEVDSELNEVGIKQSELFYDFYKELDIKKIYVSGLKRTLRGCCRSATIWGWQSIWKIKKHY